MCIYFIWISSVKLKISLKKFKEVIAASVSGLMFQIVPVNPGGDNVGSSVGNEVVKTTTEGSGISVLGIVLPLVLIVVIVGIGVGLAYYFSRKLREQDRNEKSKDGILFEVAVPRGNETEIEVAKQMFANLHSIGTLKGLKQWTEVQDAISLEIVGLPESIRFYIYTPRGIAGLVEKAINGSYPNAELREISGYNIFEEGAKVAYTSLKLADDEYKPIRIFEELKGNPMTGLTSALARFKPGEGGVIQILITPDTSAALKSGRGYVGKVEEANSDPEKKKINISQEALQAIDRKVSHLMFRTSINIVTSSPTKEAAKINLDNIVSAFAQFAAPEGNKFEKTEGSVLSKTLSKREFMTNFVYRSMPLEGGSPLNTEELATIFHFPNKEVETPFIKWVLSKTLAPPDNIPYSGLWVGKSNYRGQDTDLYLKDDGEDRMRHMYIIGQTGTGKSQFLTNMLMQDIYAGRGVAFIDPHGSDIDRVLGMIPPERMEDVVYFNPVDTERPIGWNIMDFYDEQDKHIVVNSFIGMLKKMFDPNNQGMTGPIFERSVRNGMLTAMSKKGSTLIELLNVLMDTDMSYIRAEFFPHLKDDVVRSYWEDEFANTDKFHKSEKLGYITSKFDTFITNTLMRNIIGQSESSINIREIMDTGKILLVNLSKGFIGDENSTFLGLLLVPAILRAALSRNDLAESERRNFYLYVDEFQNFATDEFATILAEARKYRLGLVVANQYISQLSEQIRDAVFGNAGTKFSFRVGAKDAEYLVDEFAPFLDPQDLVNQPNATAYAKVLIDGTNPNPFSVSTWDRSGAHDFPSSEETKQAIINLSRIKYGRDREVVEAEIKVRSNRKTAKPKDTKPVPSFPKF